MFVHDKTGAKTLAQVASGNVWRLVVDDDGVYWGEHGTQTPGPITMLVK